MRVDLNPVFIRKDTKGLSLHFHCRRHGFKPRSGNYDPHAMWLKKRQRDRHEPKDCAKEEAETGMTQPQTKGFQRLLGTTRSQER